MARVVVANIAMIVCLEYLERPLDWWLAESVWSRSVWLGVVVSAGALVYFATLLIAGGRPSQLGHRVPGSAFSRGHRYNHGPPYRQPSRCCYPVTRWNFRSTAWSKAPS